MGRVRGFSLDMKLYECGMKTIKNMVRIIKESYRGTQ